MTFSAEPSALSPKRKVTSSAFGDFCGTPCVFSWTTVQFSAQTPVYRKSGIGDDLKTAPYTTPVACGLVRRILERTES